MAGGVLVVTRAVNNHDYYKQRLESKGVKNVFVTDIEKDGLNSIIRDMKPDLMIMDARFYQCSTPYKMGEIKKEFPNLNMAAVCYDDYPADLGMYFIANGVNSYFTMFEGIEQFMKGIDCILKGKTFVSEKVKKRIAMRNGVILPASILSPKKLEVTRCISNGFKKKEIADILHISATTVENYREDIYKSLNVRGLIELRNTAVRLKLVSEEELNFSPNDLTLSPFPKGINKNSYYARKKKGGKNADKKKERRN